MQKIRNKLINFNFRQIFVTNCLKTKPFESDFNFNMVFMQKIVFSTNEENFGKLLISLFNVLSFWFDLGVLDLYPIFFYLLNYLIPYLCIHLPVYFFTKITKFLLFCHKRLKKFKSPLYKRLKARKKKSQKPRLNQQLSTVSVL